MNAYRWSETNDSNKSRTQIFIILTPRALLLCVGVWKHIHLKFVSGRQQAIYTIALSANIVFVVGITQIFRCKILKYYETLPDLNVCKSHLISFLFHAYLKLYASIQVACAYHFNRDINRLHLCEHLHLYNVLDTNTSTGTHMVYMARYYAKVMIYITRKHILLKYQRYFVRVGQHQL